MSPPDKIAAYEYSRLKNVLRHLSLAVSNIKVEGGDGGGGGRGTNEQRNTKKEQASADMLALTRPFVMYCISDSKVRDRIVKVEAKE